MALANLFPREIVCATAEELVALGAVFALEVKAGDIVALWGDLGVGKTTFVKGIGEGLGIGKAITSPTFNIMAQYEGKKNLVHIDAYRLDGREILNVLDYVSHPWIIVVEWPERLVELKNKQTKDVGISIGSKGHRIVRFNNF
jgi:tRNA threonylcarbamoyladenosine biosynthesis protein TsaE